jgi:flagellar hook-length control protein FliK
METHQIQTPIMTEQTALPALNEVASPPIDTNLEVIQFSEVVQLLGEKAKPLQIEHPKALKEELALDVKVADEETEVLLNTTETKAQVEKPKSNPIEPSDEAIDDKYNAISTPPPDKISTDTALIKPLPLPASENLEQTIVRIASLMDEPTESTSTVSIEEAAVLKGTRDTISVPNKNVELVKNPISQNNRPTKQAAITPVRSAVELSLLSQYSPVEKAQQTPTSKPTTVVPEGSVQDAIPANFTGIKNAENAPEMGKKVTPLLTKDGAFSTESLSLEVEAENRQNGILAAQKPSNVDSIPRELQAHSIPRSTQEEKTIQSIQQKTLEPTISSTTFESRKNDNATYEQGPVQTAPLPKGSTYIPQPNPGAGVPNVSALDSVLSAENTKETFEFRIDTASDSKAIGHPTSAVLSRSETPTQITRQILDAIQARVTVEKVIQVSLNPAELGRLKLSIKPVEVGIVVNILAERAETIDLVRRNLSDLETAFSDIGHETVSFSFEHSSEFENQNQSEQEREMSEPNNWSGHLLDVENHATQQQPSPTNVTSGIDIRV